MGIIWSGVQVIPVFFVFTAGGSALHSGGFGLYLFFSYSLLADRLCIREVLNYTCFFVFPADGFGLYTEGSGLYLLLLLFTPPGNL